MQRRTPERISNWLRNIAYDKPLSNGDENFGKVWLFRSSRSPEVKSTEGFESL
jgi:hypothetical protein